jgi:hypothetical protein
MAKKPLLKTDRVDAVDLSDGDAAADVKSAAPVVVSAADEGIRAPKKLAGCRAVSLKEARALRHSRTA